MTLQERLKALGARDILVIVLFVISLPAAVLSLQELIGWKESAEANPFHLCAHWTTLATLLLGLASPLALFMVGRRSLVFAYVYLFGTVHFFVYPFFWTWLAPSPHLGIGSASAKLLLVSVPTAALASAIYFAGTSRSVGPRTAFLTRWKGVAGVTVCMVLLVLAYHRLTLHEHHFLDGCVYRAGKRMKAGDFDGAIAVFDAYVDRCPEGNGIYLRRGAVKETRGDLDGALADYTLAVESGERNDRPFPRAYLSRGALRFKTGDIDDSIEDFTQAIEADRATRDEPPRDSWRWITPRAFLCRAAARLKKGELQAAAADFKKVIELSTNAEIVEMARTALKDIQDRKATLPARQGVW